MRTHRKLTSALAVLLIVTAVLAAACGPTPAPQVVKEVVKETVVVPAKEQGAYDRIQSTGIVRAGFFNEPPYAYIDSETGKLTGESPEIALAVLRKVFGPDLQIEGVLVSEFGSLIPGLQAGRFDVVASGLYIRKTRCEQVLFANPEGIVHSGFVVEKGNPYDLHSYEDLRDTPDIKVGIAEGGSELDWARKVGVPDDKLVIVQNYEQAFAAFEAGRVNVIVGPAIAMQYRLLQVWKATDNYELADPFQDPVIDGKETIAYFGAAFRIGDEKLRDAFNQEFDKMRQSRELLNIVEPFGFRESDVPWEATADQLCQTQE